MRFLVQLHNPYHLSPQCPTNNIVGNPKKIQEKHYKFKKYRQKKGNQTTNELDCLTENPPIGHEVQGLCEVNNIITVQLKTNNKILL